MKSEVINIKTDPITKKKARKVAEDMGFSLSTLLNAYLKKLIKTKTVTFGEEGEEPSEWLVNELKIAEQEEKEGWVSPGFDNTEDMMAWLNNPNRRYENGKTDNGNKN